MIVGIIQLIGLIVYELIVATISGAYSKMPKAKKRLYLFFALTPLALMTMFHGPFVGNDTLTYINVFSEYKDFLPSEILKMYGFERGYLLLNVLIGRFTDDAQWIFIIVGLFTYFSLGRWINKHLETPGLFVVLLVEMLVIDGWMSMQRQTIAFAIILFAFDFLVDKKIIPFIILVLFAACFHRAAFAFLLAYPLVNWLKEKKVINKFLLKSEVVVFSGTIIVLVMFTWLLEKIINIFPIYSYYLGGEYVNGLVRTAVVINSVIYLLMLFIPRMLEGNSIEKIIDSKVHGTIHRLSLLSVAFMIISCSATLFARLSSLFLAFSIACYSESITNLRIGVNKRIMIIATILLFMGYALVITLMRTPEWQTTYPFSCCF